MRHILAGAAIACALAFSFPALAADSGTTEFVKKAAIGGMFEVQSSKAALEKAENPKIKDLAQMLIKDHTAANQELKEIAQKESISVPSQLDTKHQGQLDTLRKTKGPFAKPFIQMQMKAHDEAIMLFTRYAENGKDAEMKAFAAKTLPTLEEHRTAITQIKQNMKGS